MPQWPMALAEAGGMGDGVLYIAVGAVDSIAKRLILRKGGGDGGGERAAGAVGMASLDAAGREGERFAVSVQVIIGENVSFTVTAFEQHRLRP